MKESILDSISKHPGFAPAIVTPSETVHFSKLTELVASCAQALVENGVSAGQRIGVAIADPIGHIIVSLSLMKLGAQQLVLPLYNPVGVLHSSATLAKAKLIVTDQAKLPVKIPTISLNWRKLPAASLTPRQLLDEASFVLLGSGTTGQPKLINLTAEQFELQIDREQDARPIVPGERFMSFPLIDFLIAKRAMFACLKAGGTVVFGQKHVPILKVCDRLAVDHLLMVVVQAKRLLAALPIAGGSGERLPRLKSLTVRSSPVSEKLRVELRTKVSRNTWIAYGTNEFGTATVALPDNQAEYPETVGLPCAGVELEIVDEDHYVVPHGQMGQIRMRATGMFTGYVGSPEETASALRDGWFYPKDLGTVLPDGTLVFKGRSDDMMICDGANIAPREIELTLELHDAVDEAVAFPLSSEVHGDVPCVAILSNRSVSEKDLLKHCRTLIGSKAPVRVFTFDEFPRNPAGKVKKRDIKAQIEKRYTISA